MSTRIEHLGRDIETTERCRAQHVESVPIREMFNGEVVWEGVVEVFDLIDHPTAKRCYAWMQPSQHGYPTVIQVLNLPPVKDPITAVRAYIASLGRK